MCNIDRRLEQQIMSMGVSLLGTAIEASLRANEYSSTDVLATATRAYQQGEITKQKYFAIIDALDGANPQDSRDFREKPLSEQVDILSSDAQAVKAGRAIKYLDHLYRR